MVEKLQEYLLDNWKRLCPTQPNPKKLFFLIDNGKNSHSNIWIFTKNRPTFFAKRGYGKEQADILRQESNNIKYAREIVKNGLQKNMPLPLGCVEIGEDVTLIMNFIAGQKMSEMISPNMILQRNTLKTNIDTCIQWLCDFQQHTQIRKLEFNHDYLQEEFLSGIDNYINKTGSKTLIQTFLNNYKNNLKGFFGIMIPIVCGHGDFFPCNIHIFKNGNIVVLDWADLEKECLPFWDLFMFSCSFRLLERYQDKKEHILRSFKFAFFEKNWFSKIVKETFSKYSQLMGINLEMLKSFFPLFLLRNLAKEIKENSSSGEEGEWEKVFNFYAQNEDKFLLVT